jgi:hypothetical protein
VLSKALQSKIDYCKKQRYDLTFSTVFWDIRFAAKDHHAKSTGQASKSTE